MQLQPEASSPVPPREELDEALFGVQKSFNPEDLPVFLPPVPRVDVPALPVMTAVPVNFVVPDAHELPSGHLAHPLPAYPEPPPDVPHDMPSGAAVSDSSGSYELTSLCPGVYEVRPPSPPSPPSVPGEPPVDRQTPSVQTVPDGPLKAPVPPVPLPVEPLAQPVEEVGSADEPGTVGEEPAALPVEELRPAEQPMETPQAVVHPDELVAVGEPEFVPEVSANDAVGKDNSPVEAPENLQLAVNSGLQISPGETARLGADSLRVSGAISPFLIDLMLLSPPSEGVLLRDGFALTGGDVFTQEDVDRGRITYRHEGERCATEDAFTFATPGGQIQPTTVAIVIRARRRAPRLLGGGTLEGVQEGMTVARILDRQVDAEGDCGMAVLSVSGLGAWAYRREEDATWQELGPVQSTRAILLGPADWLRFTPYGHNTVARLNYRAWDLSAGLAGQHADCASRHAVGGVTAFSREVTSASVHLAVKLAEQQRSAPPPWGDELSGDFLLSSGIAVVRLDGDGIWQYSLDGGLGWRDCGTVYHGRALLLRRADRLRFLPRMGCRGKVTLSVRPWDEKAELAGSHANLAPRISVGSATPFGEVVRTWSWRLGA